MNVVKMTIYCRNEEAATRLEKALTMDDFHVTRQDDRVSAILKRTEGEPINEFRDRLLDLCLAMTTA